MTLTSSARLEELARRCEEVSGPDRPLSWDIWNALGRPPYDDASENGSAPPYTTSLDAAISLIDDADEWELTTLYNIARASVGLNRDHQTSWPGYGEHQGADPVLALLSAALKARALAQGGPHA